MTIASDNPQVDFAGDDATTVFALGATFVFFDDTDLLVELVNDTTGAATTQTISTDYSVTGGDGSTGTVTMVTAPATGITLVVSLNIPRTQGSDLVNNDTQDAEVVERALDKLTLLVQEVNEINSKTIRLSLANESDSIDGLEDPESVRASKLLSFSADGQSLALVDPTDVTAIVTSINSFLKYEFTAIASQTVFTGSDDNGNTLAFVSGGDSLIVTLNGVILVPVDDYTVTTGNTITLLVGANVGDLLGAISFGAFDVANTYTKAEADSRYHNVTGEDVVIVNDAVTAPSTVAGKAQIYVDTADGDLKVKFGDGTVKTLATNP